MTAANGAGVALSGGTIPASGSCTVTVSVTNALRHLSEPIGRALATANAGSNAAAANATSRLGGLTVAKGFSPATVGTNAASVLTITLGNANATDVTGVAFTDSYPPGPSNTAAGSATTCQTPRSPPPTTQQRRDSGPRSPVPRAR